MRTSIVASLRMEAGQRQTRCRTCGYLAVWFGGHGVRGWPMRPPRESKA